MCFNVNKKWNNTLKENIKKTLLNLPSCFSQPDWERSLGECKSNAVHFWRWEKSKPKQIVLFFRGFFILLFWHFAIHRLVSATVVRCCFNLQECGTIENFQNLVIFFEVLHFLIRKCRLSVKVWFLQFQVIGRFEIGQK